MAALVAGTSSGAVGDQGVALSGGVRRAWLPTRRKSHWSSEKTTKTSRTMSCSKAIVHLSRGGSSEPAMLPRMLVSASKLRMR